MNSLNSIFNNQDENNIRFTRNDLQTIWDNELGDILKRLETTVSQFEKQIKREITTYDGSNLNFRTAEWEITISNTAIKNAFKRLFLKIVIRQLFASKISLTSDIENAFISLFFDIEATHLQMEKETLKFQVFLQKIFYDSNPDIKELYKASVEDDINWWLPVETFESLVNILIGFNTSYQREDLSRKGFSITIGSLSNLDLTQLGTLEITFDTDDYSFETIKKIIEQLEKDATYLELENSFYVRSITRGSLKITIEGDLKSLAILLGYIEEIHPLVKIEDPKDIMSSLQLSLEQEAAIQLEAESLKKPQTELEKLKEFMKTVGVDIEQVFRELNNPTTKEWRKEDLKREKVTKAILETLDDFSSDDVKSILKISP